MKIQLTQKNSQSFTGVLNNKLLLKGLEKISEHGTTFSAATALGMSLTLRPLAIRSTPDVEKENKQYAISNSICSGLIKFGMVEAIALPIEYAVKNIDKNASKFLKAETIKDFAEEPAKIAASKSYKFATQILKLGAGFVTAVPKSILTIAFIPVIMDKVFHLELPTQAKTEQQQKDVSFTGRFTDKVSKGIGKILDNQTFRNFVKKHQGNDKDIAKHITAATDVLLTSSFAYQTHKSDKIKEDRKKALIYNNVISTGITLTLGYGIDRIIKKRTANFIKKFSEINKGDPKLAKYIEGINIVRPAIIFAGIYYGILPIFSTYIAEKVDKYIESNKNKH